MGLSPPHGTVRSDNRVFSAFLEDQIALVKDRLSLTLGSKFEHNSFTGFEWEPTVRLLWTPTPQQTAWAAVSRAVRTPDVFEHNGLPPLSAGNRSFTFAGNSGLESEDLLAVELGYRAQLTGALSADIATFYNNYNHLDVLVTNGSFTRVSSENRMRGFSYGVEVGSDLKLADWWRIRGAYTFLEFDLHPDPTLNPALQTANQAAAAQSPHNQVFLQSSWDLPHNVELDLMARYVEDLHGFSPPAASIPSYISLDARLAWKPRKDLELAVVGQNLLDNHHPEFGSSSTPSLPPVEIRRSVYASITYRW
jgi:iron complex outermembrane receptor protein